VATSASKDHGQVRTFGDLTTLRRTKMSASNNITPDRRIGMWAIHVFGPALRHNPTAPEDSKIPVFCVHDPATDYREFVLVDRVYADITFAHDPVRTITMGAGGQVVAAGYTEQTFTIETADAWNWGEDLMPPRITIGPEDTKEAVFRRALELYAKRYRRER
jgi:hypothetical protein